MIVEIYWKSQDDNDLRIIPLVYVLGAEVYVLGAETSTFLCVRLWARIHQDQIFKGF